MKFIKMLIKPLTRVVVWTLAAIGALGVYGFCNIVRKPAYNRTAAERGLIDDWNNIFSH